MHIGLMRKQLIEEIRAMLGNKQATRIVNGPEGSATHFFVAEWIRAQPDGQTSLIVTADENRAIEAYEDLQTFLGEVTFFPKRRVHQSHRIQLGEHVSGQRVAAITELINGQCSCLVTSLEALRQPTIPVDILKRATINIGIGETVDLEDLKAKLVLFGYENTNLVYEQGTFSQRGDIFDVFPPGTHQAFRIEFFDDTVESIRTFSVLTQRSQKDLPRLIVSPFSEIVLEPDHASDFRNRLKEFADNAGYSKRSRDRIDELVRENKHSPELEDVFPLFYNSPTTLLDYFDATSNRFLLDRAGALSRQKELDQLVLEQSQTLMDEESGCFHPGNLLSTETILGEFEKGEFTEFEATAHGEQDDKQALNIPTEFNFRPQDDNTTMVDWLREKIQHHWNVIVLAYNETQLKRVKNIFGIADDTHSSLECKIGIIQKGFLVPDLKLIVIPDRELFGLKQKRKSTRQDYQALDEVRQKEALDLFQPNSLVVHIDHGIGRYKGLHHLTIQDQESDFALLEYHGGDKLYLPVYRLNLIQPYAISDDDAPVFLDKLGGGAWAAKKEKVKEAVEQMAADLLKLYATRKVVQGFSFSGRDADFSEFEASFEYTETRDQMRAIDEVLEDMETDRPMDRLVCGDVGFGKTEVAMRSAFRAVLDKKQVAVLVPTTLLAQQHERTFKERFDNFAVRIESISRFKSSQETKNILSETSKGNVDILVGTHRLLSQDVIFKDLGLLVIDEEHRFGVKHKEKIKEFRAKVDVLTMTATPIPRTLQMSLSGFRDLSIIETPPAERQPITTYVVRFDDHEVRTAIMKELKRGGQVFFVHNRVHTIKAIEEYLNKVVPEARLGVVHGSLTESQVEKVMLKFLRHEIDVLIATTIIESGLDFPNANTIVINRADHFGLAQLYQLRGRVGRSHREAFAYLMIPGEDLISAKAQKRLRALRTFTQLGSGYKIALRDLEIRGAGNLFGTKQSGHIRSVGIDLYLEMLERAIHKLKGETFEENPEPELQLAGAAFIPNDYVTDEKIRLDLYRRLSNLEDEAAIEEFTLELKDRFGQPPVVVTNLMHVLKLRQVAKNLGVARLNIGRQGATVKLLPNNALAPEKLVAMLGAYPDRVRMIDAETLMIATTENERTFDLSEVKKTLQELI